MSQSRENLRTGGRTDGKTDRSYFIGPFRPRPGVQLNKDISLLQTAGDTKDTVVLIFQHIPCLYLMYAEVAWVLVSSGSQVQSQIILDPYYLIDYLSVFYDYDLANYLITVVRLTKLQGDHHKIRALEQSVKREPRS